MMATRQEVMATTYEANFEEVTVTSDDCRDLSEKNKMS